MLFNSIGLYWFFVQRISHGFHRTFGHWFFFRYRTVSFGLLDGFLSKDILGFHWIFGHWFFFKYWIGSFGLLDGFSWTTGCLSDIGYLKLSI